ncbi:MAG: uroporphyrinogen-III synthase [Bacteroidota bacterium]
MTTYHSVILTAPESSIQELYEAIKKKCPELTLEQVPLIKTEKNILPEKKLAKIKETEWILFTSKNAFRYFMAILDDNQLKLNKNNKLACIGDKTAAYIHQRGFPTHFISSGKTGEDFAKEFTENVHATRILIPRGNMANPEGSDILRKKYMVKEIVVYQTNFTLPDAIQKEIITSKKYDFVIFTSPSAVDAFMHHFADPPLKCISIGPVTTKKLQEHGITPDIEPGHPGYDNIANELAYFYQNKTY